MAHYAFLDENNKVTEVIVGKDENEDGIDWEQYYGDFRGQLCKRTSYNTQAGIHMNGGAAFRKNYAGIGFIYDEVKDAFIPPKPYESWILDEEICQWKAPIERPTNDKNYYWNEEITNWEEVITE